MQAELNEDAPEAEIDILGVSAIDFESNNAGITDGRDLPWLQDVVEQDVWNRWGVTYRDVVILDRENYPIAVYNLTTQDLTSDANYDELMQILLAASDL